MTNPNGAKLVSTLWIMPAVSFIFLGLRIYCKVLRGKGCNTDDIILIVAFVLLVIFAAFITIGSRYGIGMRKAEIPPKNLVPAFMWLYFGEFVVIIAITTSRTSFAFTLARIAVKRWQKAIIWFFIVTGNLIMWLCAFILILQCKPIPKVWDHSRPGTCLPPKYNRNIALAAGTYSAFLDFVLAMFPFLIIYKLQMNKKEKAGVIIAMSFGFLAGITAAIKTNFLAKIGRFKDITFISADLLIWSGAESAVAIIAASLPFLRPLVRQATSLGKSRGPYGTSIRLDDHQSRTRTREWPRNRDDALSDKSILGPSELRLQNSGIVQTNEIVVEYDTDPRYKDDRIRLG